MSAAFAAVFLILWRYRPESRYLRTLALCYGGLSLGFILLIATLPFGVTHTRAVANLVVLLSGLCLIAGYYQRFGLSFPRALFGSMSGVVYGLFLWFLYVEPDVVARIYVMNWGIAANMLVCGILTFPYRRSIADLMMSALFVFHSIVLVAQPLLTLPFDNLAPDSSIALTTYWMVFCFNHAIVSLLMVFALTTGLALDMIKELRAATFTDPLSGLMNRRGFEQAAMDRIGGSKERRLPVAIILCDLDHFKSVNDTFGHHIGDEVISLFARVLRDVVGDRHLIGRIGGEEFAVLVTGADWRVAELIAQGVRVGFSAAPTPGPHLAASRRLTASFGIAQNRPGEGYEDMMGRADAALYQAKADGRDCVRVAQTQETAREAAAKLA